MQKIYGTREITRKPSLLRIDKNETIIIEDKKAKKQLGVYIGNNLAKKFFDYLKQDRLLNSAKKIKKNAFTEYKCLEDSIDDGV